MEHLVCWLLMGIRSGPIEFWEVWYELGNFATEQEAREAVTGADWASQGMRNVSVVPYYRVEPDHQPSVSRQLRGDERRGRTKTTATAV